MRFVLTAALIVAGATIFPLCGHALALEQTAAAETEVQTGTVTTMADLENGALRNTMSGSTAAASLASVNPMSGNTFQAVQDGRYNRIEATQAGTGNLIQVTQFGVMNVAVLSQSGVGNTIILRQGR